MAMSKIALCVEQCGAAARRRWGGSGGSGGEGVAAFSAPEEVLRFTAGVKRLTIRSRQLKGIVTETGKIVHAHQGRSRF